MPPEHGKASYGKKETISPPRVHPLHLGAALTIAAETEKWAKVIRAANIKGD